MSKILLEEIYRKHHQRGKRYGYLFCGGARIPSMRKWIGEGKKILDLGCRDGMLTQGFIEGNEVIGADIDQEALKRAKERLGIETKWLDLNAEWPFEANAFDVIVACEIMEHLFFLDDFLAKVKGTLKTGGLFIGSVPNAFRMKNRFRFLMGHEYDLDPTHVRQFSRTKLKKLLEQNFRNVEIVGIEGKILPLLPVAGWMPQKVQSLFAKDLLFKCIN
jgi:2-polyprenyl-3-methyl-5-hydroxy-6-metoxy-1,4-benzoquinol methylase